MSDFSFEHAVDVRFSDHDLLGHVNNATYVTFLEEARVAYMLDGLGLSRDDIATVLAHLEIDYEAPIRGAREVTVRVRVPSIGRTSFPMEYEVRAGDRVVATAETVQVWTDPETGSSEPVPDDLREAITDLEGGLPE